MNAQQIMSGNRWFAWKRNPYPCPRLAIRVGPLRLLRWDSDPPAYFVRPGKLYLLAASIGRWEILFWDRNLC